MRQTTMRQTVFRWAMFVFAIVSLAAAPPVFAQPQPNLSLSQLRQQRSVLAQRKRRIIMNNDGCDVLYFPKTEKVTVQNFLAKRTSPLADTQVGTIAFCPTSSGFSNFTYKTQIGTILTKSGSEYGILPETRNITQDLIDLGTDCLQTVTSFCHEHEMETFFSIRMNDTHDVAHRPDKPYFLYPPLKQQHPDWLVGNYVKRTPYGRWSSVDYARPEIRDLAFGFINEVCRNYDIDGIEMDFFRHLCYFKNTALGGVASEAERDTMTQLLQRVRAMTEQIGMQRGRPILIAVRVPDSVGYCRDMGFDIERWLDEGLLDLLITTGYFRLNPWQYSVALGHKHGIPVYPCLSDSRVRGETRFHRSESASYRGRAMNAWLAGADGLHLFNFFDPHARVWREIGDHDTLRNLNKLYFVNVRDGDPRSYLAGGHKYRTVSSFGPAHPQIITRRPVSFDITIGDDVGAILAAGKRPKIALHMEIPTLQKAEQVRVTWNGNMLRDGVLTKGWIDFPVPPAMVQQGNNKIEVVATAGTNDPRQWRILFDGSQKPKGAWTRDRGSERTHEETVDGALLIADRGTVSGDYLYYRHPWGADPTGEAVVEACVRVASDSSFIIVTNGVSGERVALWPDRIELYHHRGLQYKMDTTDSFHTYRVEMDKQDLKVLVDGQLRIDTPGVLKPRSGYARNEVAFGAANSSMVGAAYWKTVKARASGMSCSDLVVSVTVEK